MEDGVFTLSQSESSGSPCQERKGALSACGANTHDRSGLPAQFAAQQPRFFSRAGEVTQKGFDTGLLGNGIVRPRKALTGPVRHEIQCGRKRHE
jgi:hypothetical protein